jgi:hypothetical protein
MNVLASVESTDVTLKLQNFCQLKYPEELSYAFADRMLFTLIVPHVRYPHGAEPGTTGGGDPSKIINTLTSFAGVCYCHGNSSSRKPMAVNKRIRS